MYNTQRGAISLPRLLAALVIGVAVGWAAQHFFINGGSDPTSSESATSATLTASGAEQAPHFQVTLRLPNDPTPVGDDKVALPAGSRFFVEVQADQGGTVVATASRGQGAPSTQPLWTAEVKANEVQRSPVMRLDGPTGLEHLHVVLRNAQGQELARRQLNIWHQ